MRFILATDSATNSTASVSAEDRDLITGFLQGKGWHVWHWVQDLWIVKTDEYVNFAVLMNELLEKVGDKQLVFIEATDQSSYLVNVSSNAIPWLAKHWPPQSRMLPGP